RPALPSCPTRRSSDLPSRWWPVPPRPLRRRVPPPRTRSSRRICSTARSRSERHRCLPQRVLRDAAGTVTVDILSHAQEVSVSAVTPPAPQDPQARIRIIALGDHLLAGVGDARALGWLGRAVASEQGTHCRIDMFTAALPDETSAEL